MWRERKWTETLKDKSQQLIGTDFLTTGKRNFATDRNT